MNFLDARQPFVNPLVESGLEHGLGRDDVDGGQIRESGEQVEIGDAQTAGLGNPIGDCHDRGSNRRGRLGRDQVLPQRVLIARVRAGHASLVGAERRRQHPRLPKHPLGAAIDLGITLQRLLEQLLEARHLLPLAAKLVVQPKHFRHQGRSQFARLAGVTGLRLPADVEARLTRRGPEQGLAVVSRESPRRIEQPPVQIVVESLACDALQPERGAAPAAAPSAAGADRRSRVWNDDDSGRIGLSGRIEDGLAKGWQMTNADEPRPARRNH